MTKAAQNLLLILVGAAMLWITLATDEYLNYVRPGFRYLLVPAAVAVIVLGLAGLRREWRDEPENTHTHRYDDPDYLPVRASSDDEPDDTRARWYDDPAYGGDYMPVRASAEPHDRMRAPKASTEGHGNDHARGPTASADGHGHDHAQGPEASSEGHGHDHTRGPKVAWLMCLPAVAIFVIAPPALGSFTASRNADRVAPPAPPAEGFSALKTSGGPVSMTLGEFVGRSFEAQTGNPATLRGVTVRLTGFVTPRKKGGWNLTRLRIMCCAGDAIPLQVIIAGNASRPPTDSWVQVTGVWLPPAVPSETGAHQLQAQSVTRIPKPRNSYE